MGRAVGFPRRERPLILSPSNVQGAEFVFNQWVNEPRTTPHRANAVHTLLANASLSRPQ